MLDSALRCTNAQYDDPDILNHLDVIVQRPFNGDIGWNIISLQYIVHGPLAAMLESTMPTYKVLFKPLWRMKHMEFVLSMKIWKEQMGNAKVSGWLLDFLSVVSSACTYFRLPSATQSAHGDSSGQRTASKRTLLSIHKFGFCSQGKLGQTFD